MRIRNLIGYQKLFLKNHLEQFFRINKFRLQGSVIQANVQIAKGIKLYSSNFIGHNAILNGNIILSEGVHIGNFTSISNIVIGENSFIDSWVSCTGNGNGIIYIGKESYIGISNILDWSDNITIGDFVHIAGPSVGLWTHSSSQMCLRGINLSDKSIQFRPTAPIKIESNVYIGGNCTIYPGIIIGHHSIVAPNSAVTKNVEPYTMVGGVPARVIKNLKIRDGK